MKLSLSFTVEIEGGRRDVITRTLETDMGSGREETNRFLSDAMSMYGGIKLSSDGRLLLENDRP